MNTEVKLFDLEEREPNTKMPGGRTWVFDGSEHMNIKYSEMWDPALVLHEHPEEQINIVIGGHVLFTVGDTDYELQRGNIIVIPANLPHGLKEKLSIENFQVIQIIAPSQEVKESLRVRDLKHIGWPEL